MIKILYIILNGPEYGGSEKHVVDIINNLPNNYDVSLIMSKNNKMINYINRTKCKKVYQIDRNKISAILQIKKIIINERPNIVHSHAARGNLYARIAAKKFVLSNKLKLICTAHGWVLPYLKFRKIKEKLFMYGKNLDYMTLAVSKFSMEEMINHGFDRKKMKYIYNGINVNYYNKKAKIKKNVSTLSYIGRFTNQKGIDYLLEALLYFKESNLTFNFYGKGEKEETIKNFIKENNLNNVFINGFIESNKVIDVLSKTDVLLLPSIDEGFPYILVEAVSAGVPCIASNVGGVSEIINNNNGRLIKSKNVNQIVEAINSLDESNIKLYSKQCIKDSIKFDISVMISELENIYKGALKNE